MRDVMSGAHEFAELIALQELRRLTRDDVFERSHAERLLGAEGPRPFERLGLPVDTAADELRRVCLEEINRWKELAEDPVMRRRERDVARTVARSCEAVIMELTPSRAATDA